MTLLGWVRNRFGAGKESTRSGPVIGGEHLDAARMEEDLHQDPESVPNRKDAPPRPAGERTPDDADEHDARTHRPDTDSGRPPGQHRADPPPGATAGDAYRPD